MSEILPINSFPVISFHELLLVFVLSTLNKRPFSSPTIRIGLWLSKVEAVKAETLAFILGNVKNLTGAFELTSEGLKLSQS